MQLSSQSLTQTVTSSTKNGIDFDLLTDVKEKRRARLTEYAAEKPTATYYEGSVWTYAGNYDIALPCATQNEINGEAAKTPSCSRC